MKYWTAWFTKDRPVQAIWSVQKWTGDLHFGQPAIEAFTRGGAIGPVNIAYSGVYQWWYTIGLRTNEDLYTGALFQLFLSAISLIASWLHLQPKWKPSVSWFTRLFEEFWFCDEPDRISTRFQLNPVQLSSLALTILVLRDSQTHRRKWQRQFLNVQR